jgi:hypothetical protein
MRRLLSLLFVLLLAACAGGEDAKRAQELLERAEAAQNRLSTVGSAGKVSFSYEEQRIGMGFVGAAVLKGTSAGDQWLRMTGEGIPGAGNVDMSIVRRGSRMTLRSMGATQDVPVPPSIERDDDPWGSLGAMDLASCVKRVNVKEGRSFNGEPATRISRIVDTVCAFEAVQSVSSLGQAGPADFDAIKDHLGDARATLFVSDSSHLLIGGVLALDVDVDDQRMSFEVAYRLTSVNEPVRFQG